MPALRSGIRNRNHSYAAEQYLLPEKKKERKNEDFLWAKQLLGHAMAEQAQECESGAQWVRVMCMYLWASACAGHENWLQNWREEAPCLAVKFWSWMLAAKDKSEPVSPAGVAVDPIQRKRCEFGANIWQAQCWAFIQTPSDFAFFYPTPSWLRSGAWFEAGYSWICWGSTGELCVEPQTANKMCSWTPAFHKMGSDS